MSGDGPRLALLARLAEATRWDALVRRHEDDPWAYLRRKLRATEGPLREHKKILFDEARARLLGDLGRSLTPPGAFQLHKEAFESMLSLGDFADLCFHLEPSAPPAARREGAAKILSTAKVPTLFDLESLPPEKRGRAWNKSVEAMAARLDLPRLDEIARRGEPVPIMRARLARRLRRNLAEYLSFTRAEDGVREELTPFALARIETAIAASLRFLSRWR